MDRVDHDGVIQEIKGNNLMVSIITKSACVSCQVKSVCNPSEMKEKVFDVWVSNPEEYSIGDRVKLSISEGLGMLAVFLGYIIPIFTLLGGFFIATAFEFTETMSALSGIGLTGLYFLILFLMRAKSAKQFSFLVSRYED